MDGGSLWGGFAQWAFFKMLFAFMDGELMGLQDGMVGRTMQWVTSVALVLATLWVLIQGFLIISGRSRESLMGLVVSSLRAVLIIAAATTLAFAGSDVYKLLSNDLPKEINQVVTGSDEDPQTSIDKNMAIMAGIFTLVDTLTTDDPTNKQDQDRVTTMTGFGIAGPSVIGGAMLLLYKIALVLFVGFAPLFILTLLFEQTKSLFQRWLLYGLGTMFSLAVLAFMVSLATKVVAIASAAMLAQYYLASSLGGAGASLNAAAMQQGGVGLVMSVLMVMAPPMAAMFFGGTLGNFVANSSFGSLGRNSTGQISDYKQDITRTDKGERDQMNKDSNAGNQRERPTDLRRG